MAFNRPQVKCPSCKKAVDFGRVFCPHCGEAMNRGDRVPKPIRNRGKQHKNDGRGAIGTIVRACLTILLVIVIVLLLWPQESQSKIGSTAEGQLLRRRINAMEKAAATNQAFVEQLTEEEINAHLHLLVKAQPKPASIMTPVAEEISIDFINADTMQIYTRTRIWKFVLTHRLQMKPEAREGGFSPQITSAHLGHFPMVSVLRIPVITKFKKTLAHLKQEQALLKKIDVIQIKEDNVAFKVQ
jgi:endogenous inhibitor of DNA gyrase (YacG/DUF329 family)